MDNKLLLDNLILLDDTGMPKAPTIRQLIDPDIRELYMRDKTKDKEKYIAECIFIYYVADPKSPARQSGLNDKESIIEGIKQAGLPSNYCPDALVIKLISKYKKRNITEATKVVDNLLKLIHTTNLAIDKMNDMLVEKLSTSVNMEEMPVILDLMKQIKAIAADVPTLVKKLEEAKQNLMYEKETEISRGGNVVLSSMDADDY